MVRQWYYVDKFNCCRNQNISFRRRFYRSITVWLTTCGAHDTSNKVQDFTGSSLSVPWPSWLGQKINPFYVLSIVHSVGYICLHCGAPSTLVAGAQSAGLTLNFFTFVLLGFVLKMHNSAKQPPLFWVFLWHCPPSKLPGSEALTGVTVKEA